MKFKKLITVVVGALAIPFAAIAGEDSQLTVEGQLMVTSVAAPARTWRMLTKFSLGGFLGRMKRKHFRWMILTILHLSSLTRQLIPSAK